MTADASTLFARDLTTGNSVLLSGAGVTIASTIISGGLAGVTLAPTVRGADSATPPILVEATAMTGQVESLPANVSSVITNRHRIARGARGAMAIAARRAASQRSVRPCAQRALRLRISSRNS